jgi:hypothetical protein
VEEKQARKESQERKIVIQFIARNLAWYSIRLLGGEFLRASGDHREAFVIFPVSEASLSEKEMRFRDYSSGKRRPQLLSLYPGRTRMSAENLSGIPSAYFSPNKKRA